MYYATVTSLRRAYMLRVVDVEDLWRVKVDGMETTIWAIDDLQPLTFLNGEVDE